MLSALTRFFVIICVALIAAFISLSLWGVEIAIAAGIFIIAIPLVYAYINLARLRKYILADAL
jgi:two-component system phosphate regulon sensor histidine kinase PhoR